MTRLTMDQLPLLTTERRQKNGRAEPWLIYDDSERLKAEGTAGLHVLLTGVSAYPNLPGPQEPPTADGLGMRRLSSTSLSVYLILDWLLHENAAHNLCKPLATIRLLLSPTPAERDSTGDGPDRPAFLAPPMDALAAPGCTVSSLQMAAEAWRQDAAARRDGATFFYFAGHGIERTRSDQVLLLESFGAGGVLSSHTVNVQSLHNGMAPTAARPDIARTQFYFVDACRSLPSSLRRFEQPQASDVFNVEVPDGIAEDRRAPIFFAALPEGRALAVPGEQTLFSMALLNCLHAAAARPPQDDMGSDFAARWHVSSQTLSQRLDRELDDLNRQFNGAQRWSPGGFGQDAVLCYLDGPPEVPIRIVVAPDGALNFTLVRIEDATDTNAYSCVLSAVSQPPLAYPFQQKLKAGYYRITANVHPPTQPYRDNNVMLRAALPLESREWKVRMCDGC